MKAIQTPPGSAAGAASERFGLTDEQLRSLLRNMLMQRTLDNRGFQLNRQGKIPFALGSEGHEAVQAGAALAFKRGSDMLVPYYRDVGLALGVGISAYDLLLSMFARAADRSLGRQFPNHFTAREKGVLSMSSIIASQCTHAAGVAYAFKYRKEAGRAVLCTFGEGATSQGEWHEALNFASVQRLPVVFLCENNHWAISVPQSRQMAVERVIDKAHGYGLPGVIVNGVDPVATYGAVSEALDRARTGGGPTLVEATCYRFLSHSTDDDDRTYRDRAFVEEQRKDDPVPRFAERLIALSVMKQGDIDAMKADVLREINEATDRAEAMPSPQPADLYTNVYEGTYEPWL
jgi:2-oxoisovalerate dehydrogenase E1 component alpha subunit